MASSEDIWIEHPHGKIFSRVWSPSTDGSRDAHLAPIVLFHDSLGCVDLWRDFPPSLCEATGRNVVAYDRLGFGKSSPRRERPSRDFVAEEADLYFPVVRDRLGLDQFALLGHSVGGGMAIHCAASLSHACEALITEAAQVFAEDLTLSSIREARQQFSDVSQLERLAKYHGEKAAWVVDAWTECWLAPEFADWNLFDVLPSVNCPVLAIHGANDEYGTTRHPTLIGELASGSTQVEIMADTGHVPHRERPVVVIELIRAFLERKRVD